MLYLVTFHREVLTTPMSLGEFLVQQQDGESLSSIPFAPVEVPVNIDDVLQPALRNGFVHPQGLVVDASLVDIMAKPQQLQAATAAQQELADQLAQLNTGPVSVADAGFYHQQDQVARTARLDAQEALGWATTARNDILARPVQPTLEQHWQQKGRSSTLI